MGFAPAAHPDGRCRVIFIGDDKVMLDQPMNRSEQATVAIDLSLDGIRRLEIHVDYDDGRSVGDELHFCDWIATKK